MKVLLLFNAADEDGSVHESDVLRQRDAAAAALARLGHDVSSVACTLNLAIVKSAIDRLQPAVVFNLVESLAGTDRLMPVATQFLDALELPYTGASTRAILATTNKLAAKLALRDAGLPTPPWIANPEDLPGIRNPFGSDPGCRTARQVGGGRADCGRVIIKAVWEHASFRMDDHAVATFRTESQAMEAVLSRTGATGRPHFAEQFVDGREFNVTLIAGPNGPIALPPAEIDFSLLPADRPKILGYRAKWDQGSLEYLQTPRRFDFAPDDQPLLEHLTDLSVRCWHLFQMRGYARVDFRVDDSRHPWILEVNANPCLAPDAGLAAAAERAGIGFDEAILRILEDSLPSNVDDSPPQTPKTGRRTRIGGRAP
jgi:D-alanine-D-alanine ligase